MLTDELHDAESTPKSTAKATLTPIVPDSPSSPTDHLNPNFPAQTRQTPGSSTGSGVRGDARSGAPLRPDGEGCPWQRSGLASRWHYRMLQWDLGRGASVQTERQKSLLGCWYASLARWSTPANTRGQGGTEHAAPETIVMPGLVIGRLGKIYMPTSLKTSRKHPKRQNKPFGLSAGRTEAPEPSSSCEISSSTTPHVSCHLLSSVKPWETDTCGNCRLIPALYTCLVRTLVYSFTESWGKSLRMAFPSTPHLSCRRTSPA